MRNRLVTCLLTLLSACSFNDELGLGTNAQQLTYSETVSGLEPVAYWRLGEASGTVAVDSGPTASNGTYSHVTLGRPGGPGDDGDTAVGFSETAHSSLNLGDHRIYSLTRAWDNFNRSSSHGWGQSTGEDSWVAEQTLDLDNYTMDGNHAVLNANGINGVFQQRLEPVGQFNGDMQVRGMWNQHAAGNYLVAVSAVARHVDTNNFVRAELREAPDHGLYLALVSRAAGIDSLLAETFVGNYEAGRWWYVRLQFVDEKLRAKAWPMDWEHTGQPSLKGPPKTDTEATDHCIGGCPISFQPTTWQVEADDPAPAPGQVALRTDNTHSTTNPSVTIDAFWLQTPGITFAMWWKPTNLFFTGIPEHDGARLSQVGGKGVGDDQTAEYFIKFYAHDGSSSDCGLFKWYIHNLEGGLGAGVRYPQQPCGANPPESIVENRWYQFVVTFDSGDYLDTTAGISLYVNGKLYTPPVPGDGNVYSGLSDKTENLTLEELVNPEWQITPRNGDGAFSLGTRLSNREEDRSYFTGDIDEFAIFSRKLSCLEIASLAGLGPEQCQGNRAPVATFSIPTDVVAVGGPVTLDGSASFDPDGNLIDYTWNVTPPIGNSFQLAGIASPTFTPTLDGSYVVDLVVKDALGLSSSATKTVTVLGAVEFAQFKMDAAGQAIGELVATDVRAIGLRVALGNLVRQARSALDRGDVAHAIQKLGQAMTRADGWRLRGQADTSGLEVDWVITEQPSERVYDDLAAARSVLETL